jgi:hypothetical protein
LHFRHAFGFRHSSVRTHDLPAVIGDRRRALTTLSEPQMTDDQALERCLEIARGDPLRAAQIDSMLEGRPRDEVQRFAANLVQSRALNLKPWEEPPCAASEHGVDRDPQAQALLKKMLAAGLSRFEPNPLAALRKRKRTSA